VQTWTATAEVNADITGAEMKFIKKPKNNIFKKYKLLI